MSEKDIDTEITEIKKDQFFFEELYKKYYTPLVRFAENILYDADEAMDITQEVFLELYNNAENIKLNNSLKSYLYACVKYKAYNHIKKLDVIDRHELQVKESYVNIMETNTSPDEDEIKDEFTRLIDELPTQMRTVLEYHSKFGWKYQEIADEMGISINTVKTQIKRAYKRIKENFNKDLMSS